jgi:hypothetical protein
MRHLIFVTALVIPLSAMTSAVAGTDRPATSQQRWATLGDDVLEDGRTGLQWTRRDNGREIDWHEAVRYCEDKHSRWRLPSLAELKAIYDRSISGTLCGQDLCHLPMQFDLTGAWFWSDTPVGPDGSDGPELAWGLLMVNGAQTPSVREAGYGARALCVRSAS